MISVNADVSGIEKFVGVVRGVTTAVETDIYISYFFNHMLGRMRTVFNLETVAAGRSGAYRLGHVFEWPDTSSGGVSKTATGDIPLWRTDILGRGRNRHMSFHFVQSRRYVPLPDPARYGFSPDKLKYLSRHYFRFKAAVLEAGAPVTVRTNKESGLFIPQSDNPKGYVMSKKTWTMPAGGGVYAGQFSGWWTYWFENRAPSIVKEVAPQAERQIRRSAESSLGTIRLGTTSRIKSYGVNYAVAAQQAAYNKTLADARMEFYGGDEEDVMEE